MMSREEFAELNGTYGRCPECRHQIWVESGCVAECSCGWSEEQDDDEGEEDTEDADAEPVHCEHCGSTAESVSMDAAHLGITSPICCEV